MEIIREPEISGEIADRPGINQVWAGIKDHRWDVILAEESSRLYQHMTLASLLFDTAVDAGIRVICPTDYIDTADEWLVLKRRMTRSRSRSSRPFISASGARNDVARKAANASGSDINLRSAAIARIATVPVVRMPRRLATLVPARSSIRSVSTRGFGLDLHEKVQRRAVRDAVHCPISLRSVAICSPNSFAAMRSSVT